MKQEKQNIIPEETRLRQLLEGWYKALLTEEEETELLLGLGVYEGEDQELKAGKAALSYISVAGRRTTSPARQTNTTAIRRKMPLTLRIAAIVLPIAVGVSMAWGYMSDGGSTYRSSLGGITTDESEVALKIMDSQLDLLADASESFDPFAQDDFILATP